ncbi:MAG: aromatic ring-hydroxylating oxygenase subunit alpha [Nitrospirales bacterium]
MTDYTKEETYLATRLPVDRALTLISDAYRSREFYELEKDRIFSKSWVCVGYTSQVANPGDMFLTSVADQSLIITRDKTGKIHGFYNVCRHRGSTLIDEDGNYDSIRCPYHSWRYSLDGKLLATPFCNGKKGSEEDCLSGSNGESQFDKRDYPLFAVNVDVWGCFIFVNLNDHPIGLKEWLGDLPDRLKRYPLNDLGLVARKHYLLSANWKIVAENFTENYHLRWVHPKLAKFSKLENKYRCQGPGMYNGWCTSPLTPDPTSMDMQLDPHKSLNEIEKESAYFFLVFPNLCLFVMPDHIFTLLYHPNGIGETEETGDILAPPSIMHDLSSKNRINMIHEFWHEVNLEDQTAVERVQKGMAAKVYHGGRMSTQFEEPVHRFQNMVINCMIEKMAIPSGDP